MCRREIEMKAVFAVIFFLVSCSASQSNKNEGQKFKKVAQKQPMQTGVDENFLIKKLRSTDLETRFDALRALCYRKNVSEHALKSVIEIALHEEPFLQKQAALCIHFNYNNYSKSLNTEFEKSHKQKISNFLRLYIQIFDDFLETDKTRPCPEGLLEITPDLLSAYFKDIKRIFEKCTFDAILFNKFARLYKRAEVLESDKFKALSEFYLERYKEEYMNHSDNAQMFKEFIKNHGKFLNPKEYLSLLTMFYRKTAYPPFVISLLKNANSELLDSAVSKYYFSPVNYPALLQIMENKYFYLNVTSKLVEDIKELRKAGDVKNLAVLEPLLEKAINKSADFLRKGFKRNINRHLNYLNEARDFKMSWFELFDLILPAYKDESNKQLLNFFPDQDDEVGKYYAKIISLIDKIPYYHNMSIVLAKDARTQAYLNKPVKLKNKMHLRNLLVLALKVRVNRANYDASDIEGIDSGIVNTNLLNAILPELGKYKDTDKLISKWLTEKLTFYNDNKLTAVLKKFFKSANKENRKKMLLFLKNYSDNYKVVESLIKKMEPQEIVSFYMISNPHTEMDFKILWELLSYRDLSPYIYYIIFKPIIWNKRSFELLKEIHENKHNKYELLNEIVEFDISKYSDGFMYARLKKMFKEEGKIINIPEKNSGISPVFLKVYPRFLEKALTEVSEISKLVAIFSLASRAIKNDQIENIVSSALEKEKNPRILYHLYNEARTKGFEFPKIKVKIENILNQKKNLIKEDSVYLLLILSTEKTFSKNKIINMLYEWCSKNETKPLVVSKIFDNLKINKLNSRMEKSFIEYYMKNFDGDILSYIIKTKTFSTSGVYKLVEAYISHFIYEYHSHEDYYNVIWIFLNTYKDNNPLLYFTIGNIMLFSTELFLNKNVKPEKVPAFESTYIIKNWNKLSFSQLVLISICASEIEGNRNEIISKLLDFPIRVIRENTIRSISNLDNLPDNIVKRIRQLKQSETD